MVNSLPKVIIRQAKSLPSAWLSVFGALKGRSRSTCRMRLGWHAQHARSRLYWAEFRQGKGDKEAEVQQKNTHNTLDKRKANRAKAEEE